MNNKIPKVFQNKINKDFKTNDKIYYSNKTIDNETKLPNNNSYNNLNKKINEIFTSPNYIYKANVEIITKEEKYTTKIIGRNKTQLITMDNKTIPIKDIIDIRKK